MIIINILQLISVFRLVQTYYMITLSVSSHAKGLESVNPPLALHGMIVWTCFSVGRTSSRKVLISSSALCDKVFIYYCMIDLFLLISSMMVLRLN